MSTWSLTFRQSVFTWQQSNTFLRVLPTRWLRKPAGIDTERNYATVTLCIASYLSRAAHFPHSTSIWCLLWGWLHGARRLGNCPRASVEPTVRRHLSREECPDTVFVSFVNCRPLTVVTHIRERRRIHCCALWSPNVIVLLLATTGSWRQRDVL